MIKLKRVYEKAEKEDGFRILVDRLWPRGLSKEKARVDLWLKEVAPSDNLRKWFNHEEQKWPGFQKRYKEELKFKSEELRNLRELGKKHKIVTLVYGAKEEKHNQAVVLKEVL